MNGMKAERKLTVVGIQINRREVQFKNTDVVATKKKPTKYLTDRNVK
jgi:hypothetical protein